MPGKKSAGPAVVVEKKPGLGGTTFGGFQDASHISLDDPYEKKIPVPSRHLGAPEGKNKWNHPCPMKDGRTPDVYFDKVTKRLCAEEYYDPGKSKKEKDSIAAAKKAVLPGAAPWKNPNPTKSTTGPGSIFGTFQEPGVLKGKPFGHEADYAVPKKDDIPEKPNLQPRNVTVAVGKKGGFGVQAQGVYFSNADPIKDDSKRDKYDAQKEKEKKENEDHKKRILAIDKPFKSSSKCKNTFDETPGGVSKIYTSDKKLPELKEKKKDDKKEDRQPFRYSSPAKAGEAGCLARFTARIDGKVDKYDQKLELERDARKKAPKNVGTGPWMPAAVPKGGCTKSLLPKFY